MVLKKHSLTLRGHRTSITLEDEFWQQLEVLARAEKLPVQELIARIDETRDGNLSSALRVHILKTVLQKKTD
jgi:predicted DNA-binding ribbon-helix-helix protein